MAMAGGQGGEMPPGMTMPDFLKPPAAVAKKTLLQKLLPLIHFLAAWSLLAYFVFWKEPEVFDAQTHGVVSNSWWARWAELSRRSPQDGFGVQFVVRLA